MLLASCGFFRTNSGIDEEPTEAPPVVLSEKDPTKVLYNPDTTRTPTDDSPNSEICDYEEFWLVDSRTMQTAPIRNVWYTKKETILQSYDHEELIRADHLHIKEAVLKSASGENLYFLDWIKSEIANTPVVWSENVYNPLRPRQAELDVNGSYDFAPALRYKDGEVFVEFVGEARGRSPSQETKLELHLLLASFYNCR